MPPMSDEIANAMVASFCFFLIGITTWWLSNHREVFILIFSMGRFYELDQQIPRGERYRSGMRMIGKIQIAVATAMEVGAIVVWLALQGG